jgi:hypothetical protein
MRREDRQPHATRVHGPLRHSSHRCRGCCVGRLQVGALVGSGTRVPAGLLPAGVHSRKFGLRARCQIHVSKRFLVEPDVGPGAGARPVAVPWHEPPSKSPILTRVLVTPTPISRGALLHVAA